MNQPIDTDFNMNQPTEESKGGETPTDYSNMPPLIDMDDRDEE